MTMKRDNLRDRLAAATRTARRYAVAGFLLFLLAIYGFLGWRVISLNSVQPDQASVSAQLKTAGVPRIDQATLSKIQQLQDNSVQVKTLFDDARTSPFQE